MRTVTSVALLALLAGPALAQTTTAPPAETPTVRTAPAGDLTYYNRQQNEMRASKLIGSTVRNNANESIGEINEVILNPDGRVAAVVVGVGGFLGIGEREVALDFKSLRIERDGSAATEAGATVIKVNATKDGLKSAPAWTWTGGTTGTGTTRTDK